MVVLTHEPQQSVNSHLFRWLQVRFWWWVLCTHFSDSIIYYWGLVSVSFRGWKLCTLKHSSYRSLQLIFPLFKIDLSRKLGTNRKYRRLIFLIILYAKKPVRSYACSLKFLLLKICPRFGYTIWDSDLHILLRHHAIQVLVCLQFSPRTCCSKWIIIVLPYILLAKMFIVDLLYYLKGSTYI